MISLHSFKVETEGFMVSQERVLRSPETSSYKEVI